MLQIYGEFLYLNFEHPIKYPCSAKEFALRLAYNCSPYFCRTPPNILIQKETERKALLYFDFTLWIAAKLADKTMSKLIENKSSEISLT